ncbi:MULTISPECIES: phosphatidate cytidylyltransferase [Vagococcus]|uniref:Phosphatidate cytidylyltransferase n=1 Tax=Vagococcus fluvialis bH819 TaxID=1255619 RepID=A0A1X6WQY5_9ENTE|nr:MULTISPECIES: phosphatidate cytidylyltransferase [Vagococcus]SLM86714.1 Phosphatidate cytidylyltransferase [Vagococcus fluvialis bH819]HCM90922.1 phosphatidate cytidylyltransferase [Vagococcus sp.]
MKQRIITAVVALVFFIPIIIIGEMPLHVLAACMAGVGVYELFNMRGLEIKSLEGILAIVATVLLVLPISPTIDFLPTNIDDITLYYTVIMLILIVPVFSKNSYTFDDAAFPVLVSLYVGIGFQNFVSAREAGIQVLMFALFVVWATDIGAYFCGMKFGKNKLAPHISPNKTIEGSIGGIICAVIVAAIYLIFWPLPYNIFVMLLLTILFSIVGQMGDLVQSAYKRHYGVKDSGRILPGHGGILDRFDSLLFVFPLMHLVGLF